MARDEDNYKEGVDYKMTPVMDSKGKPVLDGKGKPVMSRKFLTKTEKASASAGTSTKSKPATSSKASTPKPTTRPKARSNIAETAQMGIDRAERGPSTRSGPRRAKEETTATRPSGPKGPSPLAASETSAPSGTKPFAGTKPTREEWDAMTPAQRVRWGVVIPPRMAGDTRSYSAGSAGRKERRDATRGMAKGGMVKKSGYAKGGLVKANCGASMKPAQKGTKK